MRAIRLVSGLGLVLGVFACSSSNDSSGAPVTDSGTVKDTSTGSDTSVGDDSSVKDTGTTTTDSKPSDGTTTDTRTDGGGPTISNCDPYPGDECNMVLQDCTGDQTCDWDTTKGHKTCQTRRDGVVGKGEACDPTSNPCQKGLFCYSGKCSPPCCPMDDSVCGTGGSCDLAITQPTDGGTDQILYHACTYAATCHPFKYDCGTGQVCLFKEAPDTFTCVDPSPGTPISAAPGIPCKYANDCGESQACLTADGGKTFKCTLFCWLTPPEAGSVGTDPAGRFAANGTCTVGGKSYGTCSADPLVAGGLGICK